MFETKDCVVYTGTHDNDTLQGWLESCDEKTLVLVASYFKSCRISFAKAKTLVASGELRKLMINAVISSSAVLAVIPMQDILGPGSEGRMNMPSTTGANWSWRMPKGSLKKSSAEELRFVSELYGRNGLKPEIC